MQIFLDLIEEVDAIIDKSVSCGTYFLFQNVVLVTQPLYLCTQGTTVVAEIQGRVRRSLNCQLWA